VYVSCRRLYGKVALRKLTTSRSSVRVNRASPVQRRRCKASEEKKRRRGTFSLVHTVREKLERERGKAPIIVIAVVVADSTTDAHEEKKL
jgi:hypothetical protein